jgi:hypothetical protein
VNSSSIIDSGTLCSANALRSRVKKSARSSCRGLTLNAIRWPKAVAVPGSEHRRDFPEHPIADFRDQARALGNRDEGRGQPFPLPRVVPAQKRLGARDLAGDKAQLRLEGELELAALDRFGQRLFGLDLLLMLGGKLVVEHAMPGAAARLGPIHRDVGGAHQGFDAVPWSGLTDTPIEAPMSTLCP